VNLESGRINEHNENIEPGDLSGSIQKHCRTLSLPANLQTSANKWLLAHFLPKNELRKEHLEERHRVVDDHLKFRSQSPTLCRQSSTSFHDRTMQNDDA